MSLVLVKKIPKQEDHSLQRLQFLLYLYKRDILLMRKFDDHKIKNTCPKDIDMCFKLYFSNSLIIHQVKTKKIIGLKAVWIPGLN